MMIRRPEIPPVLDENSPRLKDFQVVPLPQQGAGKQRDPIFELFNPPADAKEDQLEIQLCHALANMVAAVLACPPRSNHLWYHLFAANELNDTHMTGFMYKEKIMKEYLYDCGVELSPDGTYGRPDYLPHATRGTLSLQSLYLLLWANFGAFCMALITQPDAQEKISGPVISTRQHIRHYCVSQLRSVWWHMNNNLQRSTEELSFFIMRCMQTMIEAYSRNQRLQSPHEGKFHSTDELDIYEKMWHECIFTECYTSIHDKFSAYCQVGQNTLLNVLSELGTHFPHFPTEEEFSRSILASANVSDVTRNKFYVVSKFALMYPCLKAGGALLPDLIEFYQWIHTELAYLVTRNYARKNGFEEVITKANQKFEGRDLFQLYERVKDGYNKYMEVVGGSIGAGACANVNRNARVYKIDDDTKMLHFLSEEEPGGANDWLFIVIEDIVSFHNEFLQDIFQAIASPEQSHVRTCFPDQQEDCVYPTEVNNDVCIVPKAEGSQSISEYLQLLRSRYLEPHERSQQSMFDLQKLQEDVIKVYLVGKPLIKDPADHLRVCFKFRVLRPDTIAMGISERDLQILQGYLKENFKPPLPATNRKELECEFHSADYHMLTEVASGLRNATEHLVKSLNLPDQPSETELVQMTLQAFLLAVYGKQGKKEEGEEKKLKMEVLKDIGIQSLTPSEFKSQLACLLSLKLPFLYSTLELFVQWIKDGTYDFHHLPLVMKKHLDGTDLETLQNIDSTFGGTAVELQDGLNTFTTALVHAESHMRKTIAEHVQKPIITLLKELNLVEDDHMFLKMIPESVHYQNYVDLRVVLRRLSHMIQQKVSVMKRGEPISENKWDELVGELWKENGLKHLRDAATPFEYGGAFIYDPSKGTYGFQEGYDITEEDEFVFIDQSDHDELDNQDPQIQPEQDEPIQSVSSDHEEPQETIQPPIPADKPPLEEIASKLSVDDISEFLKGIELAEHVELFSKNGVDGSLLIDLGDNDLKDLGVVNGFSRRKIISKFKTHLKTKQLQ